MMAALLALLLSEIVDLPLKGKTVESCQRQAEKEADASVQNGEGIRKSSVDFFRCAFHCGWIRNSPMCRHRLSAVTFLDHLFKPSDFEATRPTIINRHWILHGRSATDWTVADALKLVNALATLHWLFKEDMNTYENPPDDASDD